MPNPNFQNETFYHICNRGVDKRKVFMNEKDYARFLVSMREFNQIDSIGSIFLKNYQVKRNRNPKASDASNFEASDALGLVEIIAYCLNPNHYHLLLRQRRDNGISKFMHKIGMGYTNFINAKYNRSGSLFQGKYKAFEIKSEGKLWETSFYVNGNAEIHGIDKCNKWPWSSCLDYLCLRNGSLCSKNVILKEFKSKNEYRNLLFNYIREKKIWKKEIKNMEF